MAGRLTVHEGGTLRDRYVCTPPLARIPQLAPHLDHKRNELVLDKQFNLYPIWGIDPGQNDVLAYLGRHTVDEGGDVDPATVVGYDLLTADSQPGRRFGQHGEFLPPAGWITCRRCTRGCVRWSGMWPITPTSTHPTP